jgi:hypothetical protein
MTRTKYQFTTYERDSESGLDDFGAPYQYDGRLARASPRGERGVPHPRVVRVGSLNSPSIFA